MNKQFHILNGDALLYQFSDSIPGDKIVMREALIEGTVEGDNLSEFYSNTDYSKCAFSAFHF